MKILLLSFSTICLTVFSLSAQRGTKENERGISSNAETADFAVKFAPTQMISGQYNFSFESKIGPKSSMELSVGPTFGAFGLAFWDANGDAIPHDLFQNKAKLGINVSLGYRFYIIQPEGTSLHGLYLSPTFKFNQLNLLLIQEGGLESLRQDVSTNLTSLTFQVGYQFVFKGGFVLDMYMGSGLGNRNRRVEGVHIADPMFGDPTPYEFKNSRSNLYAVFTTGVRVGFGTNYKNNK